MHTENSMRTSESTLLKHIHLHQHVETLYGIIFFWLYFECVEQYLFIFIYCEIDAYTVIKTKDVGRDLGQSEAT